VKLTVPVFVDLDVEIEHREEDWCDDHFTYGISVSRFFRALWRLERLLMGVKIQHGCGLCASALLPGTSCFLSEARPALDF
jgi:hypothetical protein